MKYKIEISLESELEWYYIESDLDTVLQDYDNVSIDIYEEDEE